MSKTSRLIALAVVVLSGFLLGSTKVLEAQQATIEGSVRQQTGEPVGSARVEVEGTDLGTLTDASGQFSLSVPAGDHRVTVTALGFASSTRSVSVAEGASATVEFVLGAQAIQLGELLVSLEATQARRAEIGSDIESFNAEEAVDKAAVGSVSDLLNSRATGLTISQSSGEVGSAQQIRIRGATSITQDNNPIIYVDGVRVSNASGTGPGSHDFGDGQTISRLDDLNPQDIESVQILKGPTAAAQYGSEAAAGVILITTKSGFEETHQFTYSTEQGFSEEYFDYPDNYFNVTQNGGFTDPSIPVLQQWRPVQNPVTGDVFARHNPLENPNTSPFRTGRINNHFLSVRGGAEAVSYYGSLNWDQEEGTVPINWLNRYGFRVNAQAEPDDRVTVSLSTNYITSDIRLPDNDRSSLAIHGNGLSGIPVTSFGTLPDGSEGDCLATVALGQPESVCESQRGNQHNTFDKLMSIRNEQELGRFLGSVSTQWNPLDWLNNRATLGIDFSQTRDYNLVPLDPDRPFGSDSRGLIDDRRTTNEIFTADVASTANFDLTDRVSSTTTVGAQYFASNIEQVQCRGEGGFASPDATACDASLIFSGFSDRVESIEGGIFLQQRFGLNEYLYATAATRVDDNSAFGENQDPIWSPSANVSAVLSDMPFWNVDLINNLRVRMAWGKAAQAPDPYVATRTFRPVRLEENGSQVSGISPLAPGNPELTAERNEEFEVGFDAGLLDDRIGLKFTYYTQETTDAIVSTDVAPSTGFTAAKFVNIGAIENDGVEGLIDARVLNGEDVQLDLDFKVSTQNPIVTSLGGEDPIMFGLGPNSQMIREGFAPGHIWGEVVVEAERDANGNIVPGSVVLAPGNVNDPNFPNQVALGRPSPSNEQSLSATLTLFDDLRIFTLADRAGGFVKYDLSGNFSTARQTTRDWAFRQADVTPEEQATIERGFAGAISYFVSDASFIKWRELTVQYQLPQSALDLAGSFFDQASLTLGVRNLATITDYRGLDPESSFEGGSDSLNAGEFRNAPPVRHFFGRLQLHF